MDTLFWVHLLVGLWVRSFAFPPTNYKQQNLFQKPPVSGRAQHTKQLKAQTEERQQLKTVSVTCHPDSLEILIKADMFGVGAPVNVEELRLGVEHNDYCKATISSRDEYKILVGLQDCGTKHWMAQDTLIYTNLLIYSPMISPEGVIRMDEAVIPIECHYDRKYTLSSSSLMPTWMPYLATQAAVETLEFDLSIRTNDWQYERSSKVFHLGDPIAIQASVRVGHHMGLRVFVSSCVATLDPDIYSIPRYVFIENGCLLDSELPGSKSYFLPRTHYNELQMVIDAFRFHNEDRAELYITCHLNAVPVNDAETPNKACTFVEGRWRSADGNDYLCGYCQAENKPNVPGKFGPRGFGRVKETEPQWRSGLKTKPVWEQEARLGPVMVLPVKKSGPIPEEELPPVLTKISRPTLYGSQWRSGVNDRADQTKELPDSPSESDEVVPTSEHEEDKGAIDLKDDDYVPIPLEKESPERRFKLKPIPLDVNVTESLSDVSPTAQITAMTPVANATIESDLPETNAPKR